MLRKLSSVLSGVLGALVTRSATFTGSALDIKDYDGNFIINQYSESTNGADVTLDGKIQDSADGSTDWQDVTGATFTQVDNTAGGAFESIVIESDAQRRYIRYVGTVAGTTPSFAFGASYAGHKKTTT